MHTFVVNVRHLVLTAQQMLLLAPVVFPLTIWQDPLVANVHLIVFNAQTQAPALNVKTNTI